MWQPIRDCLGLKHNNAGVCLSPLDVRLRLGFSEMENQYREDNLRYLGFIRSSPLYPKIESSDLSDFVNIGDFPLLGTEVYRVGCCDFEKEEIHVVLKKTLSDVGFVIALHELAGSLGFPVPLFAGGYKKEDKQFIITEDLTRGGELDLVERSFPDDGFGEGLLNVDEIIESYRDMAELPLEYGLCCEVDGIDFLRAFFIQVEEGVGRLVLGDVENAGLFLGVTGRNSRLVSRFNELRKEVYMDERYSQWVR